MAAHTSAATSLLAAVAAERGVEPSSSMTSCTLFPLMPPALFSSSVMSSQNFLHVLPFAGEGPGNRRHEADFDGGGKGE